MTWYCLRKGLKWKGAVSPSIEHKCPSFKGDEISLSLSPLFVRIHSIILPKKKINFLTKPYVVSHQIYVWFFFFQSLLEISFIIIFYFFFTIPLLFHIGSLAFLHLYPFQKHKKKEI